MSLRSYSRSPSTLLSSSTVPISSSTNATPSSTNSTSSIIYSNSASSSSNKKQYSSEKIKFLLKNEPSTYNIIKNEKAGTSICCKVFGFPTKKSVITGEFERIEGFASCHICFQTFSYSASIGTRNLLAHACVKNLSNTKISTYVTNSSSSTQKTLFSTMKNYKQNGLLGANTLSGHIYDLADACRAQLNEILQESLEIGAICVSPDLWSNNHRKLSYLELTATFVNDNFERKAADLCCKPYTFDDQTGKNLLIAIQRALEPFGIYDLNKISFISDRGTNLIKALEDYETLFCFPHRINDVLKRAFFQLKSNQIPTNPSIDSTTYSTSNS
ncbi:unnamed protein product [Rotaria sp. Silwood2]|nr:unnamed protein product [Rotaria sp. Silwood2]CAF4318885.1 unnamed protein product [Rotaria sp. Silwood2]